MTGSKKSLKFDGKDRIDSLFSIKNGTYPTQLKGNPDAGHGGEYRGYYPGAKEDGTYKGTWVPKYSQRGGRSGGAHNGADIYTGYAPFPLETPVRAATDGWFTPIFDAQSPNDAGNRAAISTKIGKDKIDFRYGHLSRFARAAGEVKKGEIIGFAGCSGNADTAGECSETGPCGLTSCHVHLISAVNSDYDKAPDPISLLGWSLDYGPGADAEKTCPEIMPQAKAFTPERKQGALKPKRDLAHQRLKSGKRRPLAAPFVNITYDDTDRLRASLAAYGNLRDRLDSKETRHSGSKNEFGKDLLASMRETWIGQLEHAQRDPRTVYGRALAVLDEEIAFLRANESDKGIGGPITRALLAAGKSLWLLTGGAAVNHGMSNRTLFDLWETSGQESFRKKYSSKIRPLNPLNKHLTKTLVFKDIKTGKIVRRQSVPMAPPECGLGVDGWAALVASDLAQLGYHITSFEVVAPGRSASADEMAVSLDFSTIGLMQSIWPLDLGKTVEVGAGAGKPAKDFCEAVSQCLMRFMITYNAVQKHSAALSLPQPDNARRTNAVGLVADELAALSTNIRSAVREFLDLTGLNEKAAAARKEQIDTLLGDLVDFNTVLVEAALKRSRETEQKQPITPRLNYLQLDTGTNGEAG